ncbi:sigma-54-dependent Fis family transcriptional regulator [Candidatus Poribacteria bacterium]|nr:sigma-54-dependent Fis family transcriptional regulator [Candidatus Poribacteria bacterium]
MNEKKLILIADDEKRLRENISYAIDDDNYHIVLVQNESEALNCIDNEHVDILIVPLKTVEIDGIHVLEVAKQRNPDVGIILTTTQSIADTGAAIKAMNQAGADYFLPKPINLDQLNAVLKKVIDQQRLVSEYKHLQQQLDLKFGLVGFTGNSTAMHKVYETITQIAPAKTTILILGESGTGKELAARAIHLSSPRRDKPFVPIHCAALTESLLESELFGHERGAFTGATNAKKGRFELADGGTLFLDEVGEVNHETQVKLLRVLDTREFERVGGEKTYHVDVRIIAATNRNLSEAVQHGEYRDDLYHRLSVVTINMPPLRERKEDIPLLVDAFITEFNQENNRKISGITNQTMRFLMRYDWLGNVRELKNCIEGMVVMARHEILDVDDLPEHILMSDTNRTTHIFPLHPFEKKEFSRLLTPAPTIPPMDGTYKNQLQVHVGMSLNDIEQEVIQETLKYTNNNKAKTARILGIGKRTLYRKIEKYGLL